MVYRFFVCASIVALALGTLASAQNDNQRKVLPLWANGAPGFESRKDEKEVVGKSDLKNIHNPSITIYLPPKDKATGAAVIVAPGGGHNSLQIVNEGYNEAKWFSEHGIAAFVLKYRLAREPGSVYKVDVHAFQDAQRAIRTVRANAAEWNVNPKAIGIIGFSAGGDLVIDSGTKGDDGKADDADLIERQSSQPNFMGLFYPAIPKGAKYTKDTPPTFMACGEKDRQNIAEGLPELYLTFHKLGISSELHVYADQGHAFGFNENSKAPAQTWIQDFSAWLTKKGFSKKAG